MSDPLAGQRDSINERQRDTLVWPYRGQKCPVSVGQVFVLRSCHIEITRTQRLRGGRTWIWKAHFTRYPNNTDRPHILARGAGADGRGYVHEERGAIRAEDDPEAPTIQSVHPLEQLPGRHPQNLREPPEPEAVPSEEVGTFTGDVLARRRYEQEMVEGRLDFDAQPVELQLAQLRELARRGHMDISADVRVIERRVGALKRKVLAGKVAA